MKKSLLVVTLLTQLADCGSVSGQCSTEATLLLTTGGACSDTHIELFDLPSQKTQVFLQWKGQQNHFIPVDGDASVIDAGSVIVTQTSSRDRQRALLAVLGRAITHPTN